MTGFSKSRYVIVYMLAVAALMAASLVVPIPSGLPTVLPCMLASMIEGQKIAKATGQPIAKPDAWRIARVQTALVIAVNLCMMAAFFGVLSEVLSIVPILFFIMIFAILMVIVFLANRFFLTMGANAVLKAEARSTK